MSSIGALTGQIVFFDQNAESNSGLPKELILSVFLHLDIKSLASMSRSCKNLNQLGQNAQLWKYLCIRDFFSTKSVSKIENWKQHYQTLLGLGYLQIPFPGTSGIFHVDPEKNWQAYYSIFPLMRELCFINGTKDSPFSQFTLLGYEDGHIALSVRISSNQEAPLKVYFKAIDPSNGLIKFLFEPNMEGLSSSMHISNLDLIKKIFRIISQYNQLPNGSLCLARKIIWSANWKKVTPLLAEDLRKINEERIAHKKTYQTGLLGWIIDKIFKLARIHF